MIYLSVLKAVSVYHLTAKYEYMSEVCLGRFQDMSGDHPVFYSLDIFWTRASGTLPHKAVTIGQISEGLLYPVWNRPPRDFAV